MRCTVLKKAEKHLRNENTKQKSEEKEKPHKIVEQARETFTNVKHKAEFKKSST